MNFKGDGYNDTLTESVILISIRIIWCINIVCTLKKTLNYVWSRWKRTFFNHWKYIYNSYSILYSVLVIKNLIDSICVVSRITYIFLWVLKARSREDRRWKKRRQKIKEIEVDKYIERNSLIWWTHQLMRL